MLLLSNMVHIGTSENPVYIHIYIYITPLKQEIIQKKNRVKQVISSLIFWFTSTLKASAIFDFVMSSYSRPKAIKLRYFFLFSSFQPIKVWYGKCIVQLCIFLVMPPENKNLSLSLVGKKPGWEWCPPLGQDT